MLFFKVEEPSISGAVWYLCTGGIVCGSFGTFGLLLPLSKSGVLPLWMAAVISFAPSFGFLVLDPDYLSSRLVRATLIAVSGIYFLLAVATIGVITFQHLSPRGWPLLLIFMLIGAISSGFVLRLALLGSLQAATEGEDPFLGDEGTTPYYLAAISGDPESESIMGHCSSCQELFASLNVVERLYFSPRNPWHPLFTEMMNSPDSSAWYEQRLDREPNAAMTRWVVGASVGELSLIADCLRDHGVVIDDKYPMAIMLLLEKWVRERRAEFVDLLLPLLRDCKSDVRGIPEAIIDAAEEAKVTQAIAYLRELRTRVNEESRNCVDRALASLNDLGD